MTIEYKDSKRIVALEADLTAVQGKSGGTGVSSASGAGGGGGAGVAGGNASSASAGGAGGNGLQNDITGTNLYYAGGGAGSCDGAIISGGLGGGGSSSINNGGSATAGTNGLGGGGGGSRGDNVLGVSGGSGIVILRFTTSGNGYSQAGGTVDTSTVSGQTIISWTATSGTRTFTPTSSFSVEYLVVAGGGGGGSRIGGGGGAGGYRTGTKSVSAQAYTIVVGAGGAGGASQSSGVGGQGTNGSDSSFDTITSTGGGGGGRYSTSVANDGSTGGSGGGGGGNASGSAGGSGTSTNIKPTDVQDNSILVEKDTGNRYWFDDEFSKSNCKAYFTLDETSGNPANHATSANGFSDGNGINGTNGSTGATQNVTGKFDKCFDFSGGNNEQVDMGNTILSGTTDFTMACWINSEVTTSGTYMLFNSYASGYTGGVQFYINGADTKLYYWSSSGDFAGSTAISGTDGAWDFAVVTRSGTTMTIYLNGSVDGTSTVSHSIAGTNMTLGGSSGASGYVFNGKIDEASIWTRALSASEISELYNSGTGKTLLEAKTATWTMEPTFRDDFSTDKGWTNLTSNTSVTTQLNYTETNSTYIRATKDLQDSNALGSGNNMSDNFVIRFELNKTNDATNTANGTQPLIGISSATTDGWFNNQDSIGMILSQDTNQTHSIRAVGADNQYTHQGDSADAAYTWTTGIRYCEVIKNATADTVTATIYTNSDYTGSLVTATVSTSGKTFSGLRYLSMRNFADNARSSTVWEMNNVQVYDGVTTVN